ncbi:MAG: helix-turn-helix domain-containing protein [Bacilli bacterium]|jgi:transcriptional regulator with XRE-family HTH domain|nr:helix-turn-helix domain-containing protein [Bacilli bacterium]
MNIEIANRLVELRKKSGLSQEELAAKLGLSRQAVSKWERAEASPDTDNLICLAKLYGVSLDTLLDTDQSVDEIVDEQVKPEQEEKAKAEGTKAEETKTDESAEESKAEDKKKNKSEFRFGSDGIHFRGDDDEGSIDGDGIHVFSKDGSEVHIGSSGIHLHDKDGHDKRVHGSVHFNHRNAGWRLAQSLTSSIVSLLAIVAYLCLGLFYPDHYIGWGVCWLVLLAIPLASSFVEALRKRKFCAFALPVAIAGIYILLGMVYGLWSTTWPIFFAIPLYYIIFHPVDRAIHRHRPGIDWSTDDDDDDCDDDVIDVDVH